MSCKTACAEIRQLLSIHCAATPQGVHYGVFPGEVDSSGRMKTVWNVIRPHNWHPKTSEEFLVQLDAETGAITAAHSGTNTEGITCR